MTGRVTTLKAESGGSVLHGTVSSSTKKGERSGECRTFRRRQRRSRATDAVRAQIAVNNTRTCNKLRSVYQ